MVTLRGASCGFLCDGGFVEYEPRVGMGFSEEEEGKGKIATSSAFAVCRFEGDEGDASEVHQSPEGRCWTSA